MTGRCGWVVQDPMFTCHVCSRVFHRDPPADGLLPSHRDALLGRRCSSGRAPILGVLDLGPSRDGDGTTRWHAPGGTSLRRARRRP